MKIVLITHHGKAGVFESTNRLAAALARRLDDVVTVISPHPHEQAAATVGHHAWDGSTRGFFAPRIQRRIAGADCVISTQRRVEVLLAGNSLLQGSTRFISIIRDNPNAAEYRHGRMAGLMQWIWRSHLRRCDHIITISHYIREMIREFAADLLPLTDVIHNGVDTPLPLPAIRARQHGPVLRLCALGRLDADKRPLDTFALLAELDRLGTPYTFTWIGGGALERDFQHAAAKHGGGGRDITVTGFLPAKEAMSRLTACDILVHFRCDEGFGLAIVEALARGIPVAGFRAGALPEIIDDPLAGALAEPGDFAGFARNVAHLAAHADAIACVRTAGRFAMHHEAEAYVRLIYEV